MRHSTALALAVGLMACQPGEKSSSISHDSMGVAIVQLGGPEWSDEGTPRVDTGGLVRIGSNQADSTQRLFRVGDAIRLSNGTIVIANGGSREVFWYNQHGTLWATTGGSGEGPGEFQSLGGLVRLSGDSVIAADPFSGKVVFYSPSAEYLGSQRIKPLSAFVTPRIISRLPGNVLLGSTTKSLTEPPGTILYQDILVRYRDETTIDTIAQSPGGEGFFAACGPEGGGMCNVGVPFGLVGSVAVGDQRVYMANGAGYVVNVFHPDSGMVASFRGKAEKVELTPLRLQRFKDSVVASVNPVIRDQVRARLDLAPVKTSLPAISDLKVDELGRIWVARPMPEGATTRPWDVIDSMGGFLGTVDLPASLKVTDIAYSHATGISLDPDGVERVDSYPLTGW